MSTFTIIAYDAEYTFEEQPSRQVKITKKNKSREERVLYVSHQALLTYVAMQIVAPARREAVFVAAAKDPRAFLIGEGHD